jgi:hypothetical protein
VEKVPRATLAMLIKRARRRPRLGREPEGLAAMVMLV